MKKQRTLFGTVMISLSIVLVVFFIMTGSLWMSQSFSDYQNLGLSRYLSFYTYMKNMPAPQMFSIVLFALFLLAVSAKFISYHLKKSFHKFNQSFVNAIQKRHPIDPLQFRFKEFADLAGLVNPLIEKIIFNEKQLQTIIDAQSNMIITRSHDKLIKVNRAFLDFFNVVSLNAFEQEHHCISEFFEEEEGEEYLQEEMEEVHWVNYILRNPLDTHKVKITKNGETYIFIVDAKITSLHGIYRVVITFSDISHVEMERKILINEATTDTLTKVANRLKFETILQQQVDLANRYDHHFCLIMLDIDNFKKVNDIYGHVAGDKVLKSLASLFKKSIRKSDTVARWGGEEFVIILPHTKLSTGIKIAEKLRKKVEKLEIEGAPKVTCSFGISEYKHKQSPEQFMHSVDTKLYRAKESGKNRVVSA